MRTTLRIIAVLVFCLSLPVKVSAKGDKKPNILFIEVDDLNYEYVSFNGSKVNKTPNVDALAQSGVFFKNAVSQGMMCGPSRNSLITGLYPHNLGFYRNGDMKALPEGVWTLPQGMQKAGYFTAWIGKCHVRPGGKDKKEAMKSKMGFNHVQQTVGRAVLCSMYRKNKISKKDWYFSFLDSIGKLEQFGKCDKITPFAEDVYLDGFFTHSALEFLDRYKKDKPFFLWVNYSVPHGPYDVEQKYHTYKPENMPGITKVENYKEPEDLVKTTKVVNDEKVIKKRQADFLANVAFMDRQVGRLINKLKELGLYENTVIVFFSDHGIMMGDHERIHKGTLFRQVTNPALIISWPEKMKQGIVSDAPVELTDLIKTSLKLAGAPKSELQQRKYSVSLLPELYKGKAPGRKVAFGEINGYVVAVDGRYRLIKGGNDILLFDDIKDPKNLVNIAVQHPDEVKRLSTAIDDWFRETGKPLPRKTY
jgi:arylsulfatase A-like enzyme